MRQIKTLEEWCAERPRSPQEIDMYHFIVAGLEKAGAVKDGQIVGRSAAHARELRFLAKTKAKVKEAPSE